MDSKDESDVVPPPVSAMSAKLLAHVSDAGLICLRPLLENSGITTFSCLGMLDDADIEEMCRTVRSAGFGLGHARALRELFGKAKDASCALDDHSDAAPVLANMLSAQLQARLVKYKLERLGPTLGQCGVQCCHCLSKLTSNEIDELAGVIKAAGFDQTHVDTLREFLRNALTDTSTPLAVKQEAGVKEPTASPLNCAVTDAAEPPAQKFEEKEGDAAAGASPVGIEAGAPHDQSSFGFTSPTRKRRFSDKWDSPTAKLARSATESDVTSKAASGLVAPKEEQLASGLKLEPQAPKEEVLEPKAIKKEVKRESGESGSSEDQNRTSVNTKGNLSCRQARVSRQAVIDTVRNVRAVGTEVVKVRQATSHLPDGKMLDARLPTAVLALLRLHVTCSGKEVSEQRIARMAMDVMEEQGYDPVRAVASLSPASLLCPESAMRVLGSGYVGIVFLEEETNIVVKVMLEDFANKEYEIFCAFAEAGLAPKPLQIVGPATFPAGSLYSIRMERVAHSLHSVLWAKVPGGPRYRLSPPTEPAAHKFGERLVSVLQSMFEKGLIHGDLHLENIGLQTADAENPFLLLDFGRSASNNGWKAANCKGAFLAGHEYDVYRLITELCASYDELQEEFNTTKKECERELRELKKLREPRDSQKEYQLHIERQIVGLQAYVAEEPKTLEQAELAFSAILGAIVRYANSKFEVPYDGVPCVRSRRMRQTSMKREKAAFRIYFQSDLFWGGCEP